MLTITVNGQKKKFNIGCHTFVFLDVLLNIIGSGCHELTLNGELVVSPKFGQTTVTGGDILKLEQYI